MYGFSGHSGSLRYYPRLKIWKQPNGRNRFDGVRAYSYDWYQYAQVLLDGRIIQVEKSYSSTTTGHMSAFHGLVGYSSDVKYINLKAPRGLGNLDVATREINAEIKDLETQLANKRVRNREWRIERIAELQGMFAIIELLNADNAARKSGATSNQVEAA